MADNIYEIKKYISNKIENETLSSKDLSRYFQLFAEIGKDSDEFQEEITYWNRVIVFNVENSGYYWISTKNGDITTGMGDQEQKDLTLTINIENVLKIFSGELDPGNAFIMGKLKLKGDLPDALKFGELMDIVADEIESI